MSVSEVINALLPPEDNPKAIRRWRTIMAIAVFTLFVFAAVSWRIHATVTDIERLSLQIEAKSTEIEQVSRKVDRGTELQLIALTRSLYDQQCRADSQRDKESLQRMIDRYEQEYRVLTRSQMPAPAVSC